MSDNFNFNFDFDFIPTSTQQNQISTKVITNNINQLNTNTNLKNPLSLLEKLNLLKNPKPAENITTDTNKTIAKNTIPDKNNFQNEPNKNLENSTNNLSSLQGLLSKLKSNNSALKNKILNNSENIPNNNLVEEKNLITTLKVENNKENIIDFIDTFGKKNSSEYGNNKQELFPDKNFNFHENIQINENFNKEFYSIPTDLVDKKPIIEINYINNKKEEINKNNSFDSIEEINDIIEIEELKEKKIDIFNNSLNIEDNNIILIEKEQNNKAFVDINSYNIKNTLNNINLFNNINEKVEKISHKNNENNKNNDSFGLLISDSNNHSYDNKISLLNQHVESLKNDKENEKNNLKNEEKLNPFSNEEKNSGKLNEYLDSFDIESNDDEKDNYLNENDIIINQYIEDLQKNEENILLEKNKIHSGSFNSNKNKEKENPSLYFDNNPVVEIKKKKNILLIENIESGASDSNKKIDEFANISENLIDLSKEIQEYKNPENERNHTNSFLDKKVSTNSIFNNNSNILDSNKLNSLNKKEENIINDFQENQINPFSTRTEKNENKIIDPFNFKNINDEKKKEKNNLENKPKEILQKEKENIQYNELKDIFKMIKDDDEYEEENKFLLGNNKNNFNFDNKKNEENNNENLFKNNNFQGINFNNNLEKQNNLKNSLLLELDDEIPEIEDQEENHNVVNLDKLNNEKNKNSENNDNFFNVKVQNNSNNQLKLNNNDNNLEEKNKILEKIENKPVVVNNDYISLCSSKQNNKSKINQQEKEKLEEIQKKNEQTSQKDSFVSNSKKIKEEDPILLQKKESIIERKPDINPTFSEKKSQISTVIEKPHLKDPQMNKNSYTIKLDKIDSDESYLEKMPENQIILETEDIIDMIKDKSLNKTNKKPEILKTDESKKVKFQVEEKPTQKKPENKKIIPAPNHKIISESENEKISERSVQNLAFDTSNFKIFIDFNFDENEKIEMHLNDLLGKHFDERVREKNIRFLLRRKSILINQLFTQFTLREFNVINKIKKIHYNYSSKIEQILNEYQNENDFDNLFKKAIGDDNNNKQNLMKLLEKDNSKDKSYFACDYVTYLYNFEALVERFNLSDDKFDLNWEPGKLIKNKYDEEDIINFIYDKKENFNESKEIKNKKNFENLNSHHSNRKLAENNEGGNNRTNTVNNEEYKSDAENLKNKNNSRNNNTNETIQAFDMEILKNEIKFWRESVSDGDSFYRMFMFGLIEYYILNKNLHEIKKILFDVNRIYENSSNNNSKKISYLFTTRKIDYGKVVIIFNLIIESLKHNQIDKAYEYLLHAYNLEDKSFDLVLIGYMRIVLWLFINETNSAYENKSK